MCFWKPAGCFSFFFFFENEQPRPENQEIPHSTPDFGFLLKNRNRWPHQVWNLNLQSAGVGMERGGPLRWSRATCHPGWNLVGTRGAIPIPLLRASPSTKASEATCDSRGSRAWLVPWLEEVGEQRQRKTLMLSHCPPPSLLLSVPPSD